MANVKQAKKSKLQNAVLENKRKKDTIINETDHEDEVPNDVQSKSKTTHKHSRKKSLAQSIELETMDDTSEGDDPPETSTAKPVNRKTKSGKPTTIKLNLPNKKHDTGDATGGEGIAKKSGKGQSNKTGQKQGHGEIDLGQ